MKKKRLYEEMNMGLQIIVLLPTKLFKLSDAKILVQTYKIGRFVTLSRTHYEKERIIRPLEKVEFNACYAQIRDGKNVQMNFEIGNLCAHFTEQKDRLCVKCGNASNEPFTRCLLRT